jgi:hypothetical protein
MNQKITSSESMPVAAVRRLLEMAWHDGLAQVQGRHSPKRR